MVARCMTRADAGVALPDDRLLGNKRQLDRLSPARLKTADGRPGEARKSQVEVSALEELENGLPGGPHLQGDALHRPTIRVSHEHGLALFLGKQVFVQKYV